MLKKMIATLGLMGLLFSMGCSKPTTNLKNDDYSLCNITSVNQMVETENGFFYIYDNMLYYADKEDMTTWVPVCNKANCEHKRWQSYGDERCNAQVPESYLMQKDDNLYGFDIMTASIYIIKTDGSGYETVYELPVEEDVQKNWQGSVYLKEQLLISYSYLDEQGYEQYYLCRLNDEEFEVLSNTQEIGIGPMSAKMYWGLRGDEGCILLGKILEDGKTKSTLSDIWKVNEDGSMEQLNFPEHLKSAEAPNAHLIGSYLKGNTFIYYMENEGFYKCDLITGETELIFENALKDSIGYVFTEDYMIEMKYTPNDTKENMGLRFYNGNKWTDIMLPEEVINSGNSFVPISVGSDRVFFRMNVASANQSLNKVPCLYYFMLNEEEPKLISAGSMIKIIPIEQETETKIENDTEEEIVFTPQDIIVFDNEQCLLKITGLYINDKNGEIRIQTNLELRKDWNSNAEEREVDYDLCISWASVNEIGLNCVDPYSDVISQVKEKKNEAVYELYLDHSLLKEAGILSNYTASDYTDIELHYTMRDLQKGEIIEEKSVYIYPKGEEVDKPLKQITGDVLIENDEFVVRIEGYEDTIISKDTIKFVFENKTDKGISFTINELTVNGVGPTYPLLADNSFSTYVSGGKSIYLTAPITTAREKDFLEKCGITQVEEFGVLLDVYYRERNESLMPEKLITSESIFVYPNGIVDVEKYEREIQETDTILVDNDFITLMTTGFVEDEEMVAKMYLVNKTNQTINFSVGGTIMGGSFAGPCTINGVDGTVSVIGQMETYILPQSSAYFDLSFVVDNVDVAEDIEFLCKICTYEDGKLGKELTNEIVKMNP